MLGAPADIAIAATPTATEDDADTSGAGADITTPIRGTDTNADFEPSHTNLSPR